MGGVYGAVESLADEKKLSLSTIVPPGLPPARGDERRLAQALLNLVGNAIKFTDLGEVVIEVAARGSFLTFSVRDTGPGIAEADQAKIFEEFRQVDGSITKTKMGWAWACNRKAHCRDARRSHLGRFQPRARGDILIHGPGAGRVTGGAIMNKTILVVEDQEDNRQILRDLLGSSGFLMIEAHDGEQALTVARSQRPDLILMDIQLPSSTGTRPRAASSATPNSSTFPSSPSPPMR